ncbi:MAG TPA: SH3 domain-containing protein [Candidatus Ruminococcus avistercoris]|nr:SH3 domain-containing protein [Candidatus Ruminococcus avistercoris]
MDNFREWLSDNLRYILLGLFIILALAVIFLGIRFLSSRVGSDDETAQVQQEASDDEIKEDASADAAANEPTAAPEGTVAPEKVPLEKEAYPEVTTVIQTYYTALGNKDTAGIKSVVDSLDATEEAKITKDPYIEDYGDVETYTVEGPSEGTYVVFARYTYKFKDIDTAVPGLSQLYVCTDEDGKLYIATREQDQQTQEYIENTLDLQEVQELREEVEADYETALESDENLRDFIENIGVGTSKAASAAEGDQLTVKSDCNVRSEPSEEGEILGKLGEGQQVTKMGSEGDWIEITYEEQTGYVRSDLFE